MDFDSIQDKIENGGVNARGRLSADEFNAVVSQIRTNRDNVATKAERIPVMEHDAGGYVTLEPNILHVWRNATEDITLTLGDAVEGQYNEYMIELTLSGNTAVVFPETIRWAEEPDFTAGNTYHISIVNNFGVYAEFEAS